jgi:hypothetical protein
MVFASQTAIRQGLKNSTELTNAGRLQRGALNQDFDIFAPAVCAEN